MMTSNSKLLLPSIIMIAFSVVCTFLYPYSRFVYESTIDFIIGDNEFYTETEVVLTFKVFTMMACWLFSALIAPIGLSYLYFYHSKHQT